MQLMARPLIWALPTVPFSTGSSVRATLTGHKSPSSLRPQHGNVYRRRLHSALEPGYVKPKHAFIMIEPTWEMGACVVRSWTEIHQGEQANKGGKRSSAIYSSACVSSMVCLPDRGKIDSFITPAVPHSSLLQRCQASREMNHQ
ncbi:hypothetical protein GGR57DRAFT_377385 [Xylariaceae sp. FL1272]|nr:hypothetical protein GGR57DRAFT_377385 [Xylariaceae sp. FL1272]